MPPKKTTKKKPTKKRAPAKPRARARRAPPERISAAQAYIADMMSNPYKEAMLNPKFGPLVGVPQLHPVDTHRVRVKSAKTYNATGSDFTMIGNPLAGVCSDGIYGNTSTARGGVVLCQDTAFIDSTVSVSKSQFTNAPYTRSQFAAYSSTSGLRARVVGFQMSVTNVTSLQDRNGTFTLYQDPRHHTLQDVSQAQAASQKEADVVSATNGKVVLTYGVVEPAEAEQWISDPQVGYANSITTGAYDPTTTGDNTVADTHPGYMGVWWNGAGSSQSFLVEVDMIVEYIGEAVHSLLTSPGPHMDMRTVAATRELVRQTPQHVAPAHASDGAHPSSSSSFLTRLGHNVSQIAESAVSGLATGAATAITGSPMAGAAAGYIADKAFHFAESAVSSGISYLTSPGSRMRYLGYD